ncbi:MAG: glycosyltransferase [Bacteroidia bacterium]
MIHSLVFVLLGSYLLVQMWQSKVLLRYRHRYQAEPSTWPQVSIWVAARNEEDNLADCLDALLNLDYPKEQLRIWVGDDQSDDRTWEIAQHYALRDERIHVLRIEDRPDGLKAKARVMAQLDEHAWGDFYLITDADVRVPRTWAKAMVQSFKPETGVVSGTTVVQGRGLWAQLQGLDWSYFMGMLNIISYSGVPATAVGNNMAIRKEAYWSTGGYRHIRFSITEDYKLYSEVCAQGWNWDNIMDPRVLAESSETKGFINLLHQRKRWLSGGRELPWYWWLLFGVFASYYIIMPVAFTRSIPIDLLGGIAVYKILLQGWQIRRIHKLVGLARPSWFRLLIYESYLWLITLTTALFFISPIKTRWKSRRY